MNCRKCIHRRSIPGDAHSRCVNEDAKVTCHPQGVKGGWANWPTNFDPIWIESCNSFKAKK